MSKQTYFPEENTFKVKSTPAKQIVPLSIAKKDPPNYAPVAKKNPPNDAPVAKKDPPRAPRHHDYPRYSRPDDKVCGCCFWDTSVKCYFFWCNLMLSIELLILGVIITASNFEGVGVKAVVIIGSILGILGSIISCLLICADKF